MFTNVAHGVEMGQHLSIGDYSHTTATNTISCRVTSVVNRLVVVARGGELTPFNHLL